ncbi:TIR domain-containing adapter molecule 1 isoform X2 [Aquila chrysaetos chrysaetos]|uniref:TIR domain-containing adapter molecule 1 isoform X2 n=1 Tax=Aquila chrysaetos chrysaetos TaxID=223781 RepID=UPI001B7D3756|nr:TIR domain-containing adapter molecule 1 isoform X2 [Aquila chrysaetos chrysaetos]
MWKDTSYLQTVPGARAPLGFSAAGPGHFRGREAAAHSARDVPATDTRVPLRTGHPRAPGRPRCLAALAPLRPAPPRRCLPALAASSCASGLRRGGRFPRPRIVPLPPARPRAPGRAGSACTEAGGGRGAGPARRFFRTEIPWF